jgi:MFS family permease
VGRTAISVALACQIVGGALATALAGRVRWIVVFLATSVAIGATWAVFASHPPGWLFIAAFGTAGLAAFVANPFLVPMTVEADPSRRAAMQSGPVQLLAGAFGPLVAALAVRGHDARGVLVFGAALLLAGLTLIVLIHRLAARDRAAA